MPDPAAWHVDSVGQDDDRRLHEIMAAYAARTGERPTKSGTIKRAVRRLWEREIGSDDQASG